MFDLLNHRFGWHLNTTDWIVLTFVSMILIHLLLMSKDFRMFVIIGTFSFVGSFGKQLGILLGKAILQFFRFIKIAINFHNDTYLQLIRALEQERQLEEAEKNVSS